MNHLKKLSIAFTIVVFGLMAVTPVLVAAQTSSGTNFPPTSSGTNAPPTSSGGNSIFALQNPLGSTTSICQLLKTLLNVIILLGIPIATFFVVYAGFKLVLARGRPGEIEKARLNLFYTVVGIAIFLGAWLLAQVISNTIAALGIQILGSCTS
jgi:hypothetical protein